MSEEQASGPPDSQERVQVVLSPEARQEVLSTATPPAAPAAPAARAPVHVASNLMDVATGRVETVEEKEKAREQHDLNDAVHTILMVGIAISTVLMVIGVVEDLVLRQALPTVEPDLGTALSRLLELRASGFMGVGLLVLIATPILRVLGSILAFAYERDWRFVGITLLVFAIVMTSIMLGKG